MYIRINHNLISIMYKFVLEDPKVLIYFTSRTCQPWAQIPSFPPKIKMCGCAEVRFHSPPAPTLLKGVLWVALWCVSLAKASIVQLISTLNVEFICQAPAKFCFIWRLCICAEEYYVILEGILGRKIVRALWETGVTEKFKQTWTKKSQISKIECCPIFPKSPAAELHRCVGGRRYAGDPEEQGAPPYLRVNGGTEEQTHHPEMETLLSQETSLSFIPPPAVTLQQWRLAAEV